MPNVALDTNELSNIKGGIETPEESVRVCDTGACSSNLESLIQYCKESINTPINVLPIPLKHMVMKIGIIRTLNVQGHCLLLILYN